MSGEARLDIEVRLHLTDNVGHWLASAVYDRLCRRLFYVAGIVPSDGGAKQLCQRGNAELFLGSGAVSLDGFETQIQIAGNFRRRAALAEQLKNFKFAVTQT